ncbi:MAG: adenylate kinase [Fibrobacterota bacterium]|nr:adenylate kinase [Fibrobacterota bacterium]QQS06442.1 MAG: adenylate kinase [Fibrobacterota bacterium]
MDKYVIFGPQGSGKGTQSELLCKHYGFVHISLGDIFRWHMANHTKIAARITRIMNQGLLVPDEIVEEVVHDRLEEHDWNWGFVLDGFPRTRPQAEFLFENWNLDAVIYLDVPDDVVEERVMKRAATVPAGQAQSFTKRLDDTPEVLRVRLREYHEKTKPLIELYDEKRLLRRVNAMGPVEEVFEDIVDQLKLAKPSTFA